MRPFQAPRNRRELMHPAPDDDHPAHPAKHLGREVDRQKGPPDQRRDAATQKPMGLAVAALVRR